jgi:hypothetical protein
MPKEVFDTWLFDICLVWKVFANIPFHKGVRIPFFTFQEFRDGSLWNISKLNGHFILLSMAYLGPPHQVLVWWGFWT